MLQVEKTEFDLRHVKICTYGKGQTKEVGFCQKEDTMGAFKSSKKDTLPKEVMLTYAHVCSRMMTCADVSWRMLTYADAC